MRVIIVGASGTLGSAVSNEVANYSHEIISINQSSGDYQVDITDENQVKQVFEKIGPFDALIATAGKLHFDLLENFDTDKWFLGIKNKLMGQVNLVMHGLTHINENGSFTLTSGLLNHDPIIQGCSAAMVNGGLEGFVTASAIGMPKGIRINIVSPTLLSESAEAFGDYFKGYVPVPAKIVSQAYIKSMEGHQTGKIYRVGW